MNDLIAKAWRVVNSCQTHTQALAALRYIDLLSSQYPDLDILPLRREIITLFDLKNV